MKGRQTRVAVVVVGIAVMVGLALAILFDISVFGGSAGQSVPAQIAAAKRLTADATQTMSMSKRTPLVVGVGAVFGVGLGALLGSSAVYRYWGERLS